MLKLHTKVPHSHPIKELPEESAGGDIRAWCRDGTSATCVLPAI